MAAPYYPMNQDKPTVQSIALTRLRILIYLNTNPLCETEYKHHLGSPATPFQISMDEPAIQSCLPGQVLWTCNHRHITEL